MLDIDPIPRFLIVGQGIAGSMLSFEMLLQGLTSPKDMMVVDAGMGFGSTGVSTGILNPVGFKRMNKSYGSEFLPFAWQRFTDLSDYLQRQASHLEVKNFIDRRPLVRRFASLSEQEKWLASGLSGRVFNAGETYGNLTLPHGGASVPDSGRIDCRILLRNMRQLLKQTHQLKEATFNLHDLLLLPDTTVILCTGVQHRYHQPSDKALPDASLPYYPVKGEVLELCIPDLILPGAISQGITLIPTANDTFILGSNYQRNFTSCTPDQKTAHFLLTQLKQFDLPEQALRSVTVLEHRSGVRPAAKDRTPYIGPLFNTPSTADLYTFNGLGSRGIMAAPALASALAEHLLQGTVLPETYLPQRALD